MVVAEITGLQVKYGSRTVIEGLNLTIPEGCIGLLGPNGAGKTTLIKTLLGFLKPSEGQAKVVGLDVRDHGREVRQKVGYMPEQDCHIPGMTAVMFVAYAGELSGLPKAQALRRAHEVLEYVGLGEARYRKVETYSTGMKQRIKFAQALVHGPQLLLLDEPTNGLDPRGREEMLDLVRSVSHGKGLSVIVSSHLLPDIERTCDSVIVVNHGQVMVQGSVKSLKHLEGKPVDVELREPNEQFPAAILQSGGKVEVGALGTYRVHVPGSPTEVTRFIVGVAKAVGAQVRGIKPGERSLEDIFMGAMQGGSK